MSIILPCIHAYFVPSFKNFFFLLYFSCISIGFLALIVRMLHVSVLDLFWNLKSILVLILKCLSQQSEWLVSERKAHTGQIICNDDDALLPSFSVLLMSNQPHSFTPDLYSSIHTVLLDFWHTWCHLEEFWEINGPHLFKQKKNWRYHKGLDFFFFKCGLDTDTTDNL